MMQRLLGAEAGTTGVSGVRTRGDKPLLAALLNIYLSLFLHVPTSLHLSALLYFSKPLQLSDPDKDKDSTMPSITLMARALALFAVGVIMCSAHSTPGLRSHHREGNANGNGNGNGGLVFPSHFVDLENGLRLYGNFTLGRAQAGPRPRLTKRAQSCTSATIEGVTSDGSASVGDCTNLVAWIWTQNVAWSVSTCGVVDGTSRCYKALVTAGTCVFGAAAKYPDEIVQVGNVDAGDLTADSTRFQAGGRVGARGDASCLVVRGDHERRSSTNWGVYHS